MFSIKVVPVDGAESYHVKVTSRDLLRWERTTRGNKTTAQLINEMPMGDLYKAARFAAIRLEFISPSVTVSEWEELVDIVPDMDVEEEEKPDPTRRAPSAES